MAQTTDSKVSAKKIFALMKEYFLHSDEKLFAWLLLIGVVLCIIALVALMTALAWWSAGFLAILSAYAFAPFLISIAELGLIVTALVGITVLKNYLVGKLSICWRNWLTKKIISELFDSANNYLDLKRFSSIVDNISQRVQEDIKNFVELTLSLGTKFVSSVLSIAAFSGTLWVVGGALTFALFGLSIVIPGFLVWVALIVAIVATVVTYFIGKPLPKITQEAEHAEADFRRDITQLDSKAENIAEEHAEDYYKTSLENTLQRVKSTADQKLYAETKITAFQNFYLNAAQFLPYILAAPLYFTRLIEIAQLMQIAISFGQVSMSMSMMVDAYMDIATCRASIERIVELQTALEKEGLPDANAKLIIRKERDNKETINIKNVSLMQPQASSSSYLLRGLNMKLIPGEHVLIKGRSGIGKSTVFKVISGTWEYGDGKISVPQHKRFYFLPQNPTLPYGTLKGVLTYPEPTQTYTDEQCVTALQAVGGMDDFTSILSETRDWSTLSGGQQQKVAFARVLLKKPDWLFLDEATSGLDNESEKRVYRVIQEELKDTTIVSIGHRNTIEKYHSKILHFKMKDKEQRVVELEETQVGDDARYDSTWDRCWSDL